MAGKKPSGGSTNWGISWADVGQAVEEHESHHACKIEFSVYFEAQFRNAPYRIWTVSAKAIAHRGRPEEMVGLGQCSLGGNRGAASMAGAYLRALLDACDNLQDRRQRKRKAPEVAQLPLPE